ncbi:hypothetical protein ACBR40_30295 [Nonomuraea sp. AD125B]|uniref:hypothetical protein n=1 Tax=Nonomuraea sp. AD125B TaxID=3242897 RepID=UPI0035276620
MAKLTLPRHGFWDKRPDVADFRGEIFEILVTADLGDVDQLEQVADKARDAVKNNHATIPKA